MAEPQQDYEPYYATREAPLRNFFILFIIGVGFVGMIAYIPMIALFGYMLVAADHYVLYAGSVLMFPLLVGVGIWATKTLYREFKRRIINNQFPSGFDLEANQLSYQFFNMETDRYISGDIPYSMMQRCVVSIHPEPIVVYRGRGQPVEIEGYVYFPFVHIVYTKHDESDYYSTILSDKETTSDVLTTLKHHGVPLKMVLYDLSHVPDGLFLRVITEDIPGERLDDPEDIFYYIDQNEEHNEAPETYMDAYREWLIDERGVMNRRGKPWHAFALLIGLSLVAALGFLPSEPLFLLTVVVPYGVVLISYLAFNYSLREQRYWKTLLHIGVTFIVFGALLWMTGNQPFSFHQDDSEAIPTFQNQTSEAVIGTLLGFYAGSYIFYVVAKQKVRKRWPTYFHEEYAWVKNGKSKK